MTLHCSLQWFISLNLFETLIAYPTILILFLILIMPLRSDISHIYPSNSCGLPLETMLNLSETDIDLYCYQITHIRLRTFESIGKSTRNLTSLITVLDWSIFWEEVWAARQKCTTKQKVIHFHEKYCQSL